MIMVVAHLPLPDKLVKLEPAPDDINQAITNLVQFVSAGFQAPSIQDKSKKYKLRSKGKKLYE